MDIKRILNGSVTQVNYSSVNPKYRTLAFHPYSLILVLFAN